tara:strand:- start:12153 stop:12329 length:177 start_codon:yes stop_codon:yes gene_type:complete
VLCHALKETGKSLRDYEKDRVNAMNSAGSREDGLATAPGMDLLIPRPERDWLNDHEPR